MTIRYVFNITVKVEGSKIIPVTAENEKDAHGVALLLMTNDLKGKLDEQELKVIDTEVE